MVEKRKTKEKNEKEEGKQKKLEWISDRTRQRERDSTKRV